MDPLQCLRVVFGFEDVLAATLGFCHTAGIRHVVRSHSRHVGPVLEVSDAAALQVRLKQTLLYRLLLSQALFF